VPEDNMTVKNNDPWNGTTLNILHEIYHMIAEALPQFKKNENQRTAFRAKNDVAAFA